MTMTKKTNFTSLVVKTNWGDYSLNYDKEMDIIVAFIKIYADINPNSDGDIIRINEKVINKLMGDDSFSVESVINGKIKVTFENLNGQWNIIVSYKQYSEYTVDFSEYVEDEIEVNEFVNTIVDHYLNNQ